MALLFTHNIVQSQLLICWINCSISTLLADYDMLPFPYENPPMRRDPIDVL